MRTGTWDRIAKWTKPLGRALAAAALAAAAGAPASALADKRSQGFVEVRAGESRFVDFTAPRAGRPTIVLLNGLTYRTGPGCWERYANELRAMGFGVFMYDMKGQGQTLLRDGLPSETIDFLDQAEDLALLLERVGLRGPQHFFALSYGTEVGVAFAAKHPERVATMILAAAPDGPIKAQDDWVRGQIAVNRVLAPFNPASYEELYEYYYRILVYSTYPAAEPIVLEHPYKLEAVFRLGLGAKAYRADEFTDRLPAGAIFQIDAGADRYVERSASDRLWRAIPDAAKLARVIVDGVEHKIPEAEPRFAAQLTKLMIERNPILSAGKTFIGLPRTGMLKPAARNAAPIPMPI